MIIRGLLFGLMTFGIAMVVSFLVAALIKLISIVVQREKKVKVAPAAETVSKHS